MSFDWKDKSLSRGEAKPKSKFEGEPISRRRFLGYATIGIGAVITALMGIPLIGSLISPVLHKKRGWSGWVELGKIEDFEVGRPTMVQWTTAKIDGWVMETAPRAVWVVKQDEENFTVFNPRCTHLSCAYSWKLKGEPHQTAYGSAMPDKDHFFCPCHDGIFDIDGTVLGGPPPRPLDTLSVKVEDGKLFTIYKDFRAGIAEKIEL
ncbi:MAG: Rieske 2Fe-2S domain-containing protein [Dehalococcoidales bacterium]